MKQLVLIIFSFICSCISKISIAQQVAELTVQLSGKQELSIPQSINLDQLTHLPDSLLSFIEIVNGQEKNIPYQIDATTVGRLLYWTIMPTKDKIKKYILFHRPPHKMPHKMMDAVIDNGVLKLNDNNHTRLAYNFKTVYPPAGVDTVYRRSGFIHPLYTPHGQPLTRVHAPDHYHHWGLWNPWTHVLFEKDTIDFWNLADRKGTVRFVGFGNINHGNVYTGFTALHEHVAYKKDNTQKPAIDELQSVKIFHTGKDYYIMDMTIQLSCASASPVKLLEYRYGGLGLRATEEWGKDNSLIFTSEGNDRKTADGSKARWCVTEGKLGNDYGGFEIMSFPANYNYPEPLRVWPESMNGRGDVFVNFSPTKDKDWLLEPGKTYLLRYRFLVYNNSISKAKAEEAWQSFAQPPVVQIKKF